MPLQTQYVAVDFGGALDEKTDQRLVVPGNFTNVENAVYTKTGALEKRPGNDAVTSAVFNGGGSLPQARSLVGHGDSLLMYGEHNVFALNDAETAWYNKDNVPEPTVVETVQTSVAVGQIDLDSASGSGLTVYVYSGVNNLNPAIQEITATVVDANDNVIFNNFNINSTANCKRPRCVVVGTTAIITYIITATGALNARTLNLLNPTSWGVETQLVAAFGNQVYDVVGMTSLFAVVYQNGANRFVQTFSSALAAGAPVSYPIDAGYTIQLMAIAGDQANNRLWIGYSQTNGILDQVLADEYTVTPLVRIPAGPLVIDSHPVGVVPPAFVPSLLVVRLGIALLNSGNTAIFVANTAFPSYTPRLSTSTVWKVGVTGGTPLVVDVARATTYNDICLVSKPFVVDSKVYVGCENIIDGTYFIADVWADEPTVNLAFRPVAAFAFLSAQITNQQLLFQNANPLAGVSVDSATLVRIAAFSENGDNLLISSFAATFGTPFLFSETGASLVSSGGVPSSYDGAQLSELGFLVRPEVLNPSAFNGVGTLSPGTYRYYVTYEWPDAQGQLYKSRPSDLLEVPVVAPADTVSFEFTYNSFTTKQTEITTPNPVQVIVYRETTPGSGSYRRLLPANLATAYNNQFNRTDIGHFIFTDTGVETPFLANNVILYTQSQAANDAPPTSSLAISHGNRVWLAGQDNPIRIWFSKPILEGEPTNFNGAMTIDIPEGGAITALASMDDKLVVFKTNRIFVVLGEGPNRQGAGQSFSLQRVANDSGCTESHSTVTTREGVMYKAPFGISLLSRGLQASYIGNPVEDIVNANAAKFSSAVNHPTEPWVLFTLGSSDTLGVVILYDYFQQKWAKWYFTPSSVFAQDATIYNNRYAWITRDSSPYVQSMTQYRDSGSYVSMVLETAWLKWAGLVGFQRIKKMILLGLQQTPHALELSLGHNYAPTYSQTLSFDSTALNWASEQFAMVVVDQKSSSMRIKMKDVAGIGAVGTGRGVRISGIGLEVGVKSGVFRLPIAQGG